MQMRVSKIFWSSSGGLRLLGLGVCLLLLVAWAQQPNGGRRYSDKTYNQPIQRRVPSKRPGDPPVLAYWIFGSKGDSKRILRLLKAVYHPRNQYLLNLDAAASEEERTRLATTVQSEKVFEAFGNVNVIGKSYAVNMVGASGLAAMLHAAALLLKLNADWDWFTGLSASDYPLLTQDDILYAFTNLTRGLNFVLFANNTIWKEQQRINHIVVDTNLYLKDNGPIFHSVETRETPNAFKIHGGSPWMILSRGLIEHCVIGWDNLPRKLLMYFTNMADPIESYFHTVLCNSPEFRNTMVNNNLRLDILGKGDKGDPTLELNKKGYDKLVSEGEIFARPFAEDDSTLKMIDKNILDRQVNLLEVGKWCMNQDELYHNSTSPEDFCSRWDDIDSVKPGHHGVLFRKFLSGITAERRLRSNQCGRN